MPAAYIANFQSPSDLQELEWFYERGASTNLGAILEVLPGNPLGEWTAPRWAKTGDLVFFMCAATSPNRMGHVCKQARDADDERLIIFAEKERTLYKQYAGKIVAMGRVAAEPYTEEGSGPRALKRAPIRNFIRFYNPIIRDEYIDFIKVSRTGSITKLDEQQMTTLLQLAKVKNNNLIMPEFRWGLTNDPTAYNAITRYAGRLARDPGMMHCVDSTPGQELWRYQMSDVMQEFDQTFFDSGLLDPDYDKSLEDSGAWTLDTDIRNLDVSHLEAPIILSILTAAACDNWYQEGNLLFVAQSGLLDRCLKRLEEIAMPFTQTQRSRPIAALGFSRITRRFLQRLGVRYSDDLALLDASQLISEGASAEILDEVRTYLASPDAIALPPADTKQDSDKNRRMRKDVSPGQKRQANVHIPAFRFRHVTLTEFLSSLELDESSLQTIDTLHSIANALLLDSNVDLCIHSVDKRVLRSIAKETALVYEGLHHCQYQSWDGVDSLEMQPPATGRSARMGHALETGDFIEKAGASDVQLDMDAIPVPLRSALGTISSITAKEVLEMGTDGLRDSLGLSDRNARRLIRVAVEQRESSAAHDAAFSESESTKGSGLGRKTPASSNVLMRVRQSLVDISEIAVVSPLAIVPYVLANVKAEDLRDAVFDSLFESVLISNPWGLTEMELLEAANELDETIASSDMVTVLERLRVAARVRHGSELWFASISDATLAIESRVKRSLRKQLLLATFAAGRLELAAGLFGVDGDSLRAILVEEYGQETFSGTMVERLTDLLLRYELDRGMVVRGLHASVNEWNVAISIADSIRPPDVTVRAASELLEDRAIPLRIRIDLEREVYRDRLRIGDEYVEITPESLLLQTLKSRCGNHAVSSKELIQQYKLLLDDYGLSARSDLDVTNAILNTLRQNPCVLVGLKLSLKYYDYNQSNVASLIASLGLEDLEGREISTALFLSTKADLLKDYEIEDPYQLHSLLVAYAQECTKTGEIAEFTLGKAPLVNVGHASRERQVIELARELSPISATDFAHAYEDRYGVSWTIVRVEFVPSFLAAYIKNGVITLQLMPLSGMERRKLSSMLTEDFYKMSHIEGIFKNEFPEADGAKLNALSLQLLGFEIHGSCALRRSWESVDAYFDSLVLAGEFFDENVLPRDIVTSVSYRTYLRNQIRARKLLPYDEGTMITQKGLQALEIEDKDLLEFASRASSFCKQQDVSYCTAKSLVRRGFNHELLDFEMADEFYSTVLCSNDTQFSALSCNHKTIACLDSSYVAISAFLDSIVEEGESLEVEDLIEVADEVFGVTVTRQNVLAAPKKTGLYYCETSDMIYKDKDTFIRKVF